MGDIADREQELSLLDHALRMLHSERLRQWYAYVDRAYIADHEDNMSTNEQFRPAGMMRIDGPCVITINQDNAATYKNVVDSKIVDLLAAIDLATDYERKFIIDISKWHRAGTGMSQRQRNFLDDLHRRYVP